MPCSATTAWRCRLPMLASGEPLRQLEYKATELVKVNRSYASSKTCSACGAVNGNLTIPRAHVDLPWVWRQPRPRLNAAQNILQEGLRLAAA